MKNTITLLLCLVLLLSYAKANVFIVNSTLNTPDLLLGNGICDDGFGHCTFPAALDETNYYGGRNTIIFDLNQDTLFLGAEILSITNPVTIIGNECVIDARNSNSSPIIRISASHVTITGLQIVNVPVTGLLVGYANHFVFNNGSMIGRGIDHGYPMIEFTGSDTAHITNSYFEQCGLGIRLGFGSDHCRIENCTVFSPQHSGITISRGSFDTIINCCVDSSYDFGSFLISGSNNCLIDRLTATHCRLAGIIVGGSNLDKVSNNIIRNCSFIENTNAGISIDENVDHLLIDQNLILRNGIGIASNAVIHARNVSVTNTTISGSNVGISYTNENPWTINDCNIENCNYGIMFNSRP